MARPVLALLVLVCLVAVCRSTYEDDLKRQLRTHECRKLIRIISKCGYKKRWTTQLQKDLAATMAQRPFHDDLNSCLSLSLEMGGNKSYCKDAPSLRIYLQCSRMALFRRVDVKNKFAAIKFHGGYDHCVKVHMGMLDDFGEMPMDDDDDDDDDEDDDGGKVEDGVQDKMPDKSKASMTHAHGGKIRRRKSPMHETEEMDEMDNYPKSVRHKKSGMRDSRHRYRKPASEEGSPGRGSGRGPDDVIRRRPYDKINRHHGLPYEDDETMLPATEHGSPERGGSRGPDDVIRRRPYDKINRHHGLPYDEDETMLPATEHGSPERGGSRGPDDVIRRRPYDKINRHHGLPYDDDETMLPTTEHGSPERGGSRGPDDVIRRRPYDKIHRHHGLPYDDDETMPRHRRQPRDEDDDMPVDVETRKSGRRPYRDSDEDDYD